MRAEGIAIQEFCSAVAMVWRFRTGMMKASVESLLAGRSGSLTPGL